MSRTPFRLAALLTALALALTACSAGGAGSSSSVPEEPSAGSSGGQALEAVPTLAPSATTGAGSKPKPEPEPGPRLTQEDVDRALEQVMEHYSAAGVSVATVEQGQLSQAGAWGWAVKNQREMTPDTKIRIASISKVVVAMCTMAMAEDGLLDLDAPISEYWGKGVANPYSKKQPTVRDFMTHTSSVKDREVTRGLSKLRGILQSKSGWRSMEPGNGGYWFYSNFGISILGTTLELAADQLLDDYLQERFLEPMGIRASFFGGRLKAEELAELYHPGSMGRTIAEQRFTPYTEIGRSAALFPGGFTVSSVDMAKLVAVLANDGVYKEPMYAYTEVEDLENGVEMVVAEPIPGKFEETRLLSEASVADLETPRFRVDLQDYASFEQCLVLRRQEDVLGQEVLYYHTGSAYGVFSLMTYNPVTRNGVVVITTGARRNMNGHGMYALCYDLMGILYESMEADPA